MSGPAPAVAADPTPHGAFEVLAIRFGTLTARRSQLFYGFPHYGEPDADEVLDYFFWVVRHPGGTLVVDTGFASEVAERRGRTQLIHPAAALEQLGIDPLEVDELVLTHFHYDHIGNVALFPNARLWVAAREYDFFTRAPAPGFQIATHVEDDEVAEVMHAYEQGRVELVEHEATPVDGVSLRVVDGHAPGQLIVTVRTPNGSIVLASDAVHLYEELAADRPFHVMVDLPGMYRTFAYLRGLEAAGAEVLPGHDHAIMSRFPLAYPDQSGTAYRIVPQRADDAERAAGENHGYRGRVARNA